LLHIGILFVNLPILIDLSLFSELPQPFTSQNEIIIIPPKWTKMWSAEHPINNHLFLTIHCLIFNCHFHFLSVF
jgi:hypothetical protein